MLVGGYAKSCRRSAQIPQLAVDASGDGKSSSRNQRIGTSANIGIQTSEISYIRRHNASFDVYLFSVADGAALVQQKLGFGVRVSRVCNR